MRVLRFILGTVILGVAIGFGGNFASDRCQPGSPCDTWMVEQFGSAWRWFVRAGLPYVESLIAWFGVLANAISIGLAAIFILLGWAIYRAEDYDMSTLFFFFLPIAGPSIFLVGKSVMDPDYITQNYPWVIAVPLLGLFLGAYCLYVIVHD